MEKNKAYNTKARKLIFKFLAENSDTTVSVSDIMAYLNSEEVSISFTTVYRYLSKLTAEQKVIKLSDESGQRAVYQLIGHKNSCNEHIHIQCTQCGKLEHIECDFMEHIRTHLYEEHGFTIKCDGSILYGICSNCKNNLKKS